MLTRCVKNHAAHAGAASASPNNPTGMLIDEPTMKSVDRLLHEVPDLVVLTDDLYRQLAYSPSQFVSLLRLDPSLWGGWCWSTAFPRATR